MMLVWVTIGASWLAMGTFMVALCRAAACADAVLATP
jgi:hypothetical protein